MWHKGVKCVLLALTHITPLCFRELAALTCSPQFKQWHAAQSDDAAAPDAASRALFNEQQTQWGQTLQPLLLPLLAAMASHACETFDCTDEMLTFK